MKSENGTIPNYKFPIVQTYAKNHSPKVKGKDILTFCTFVIYYLPFDLAQGGELVEP